MDLSTIELPSNRKFGLFFVVVFLLAGGYVHHLGFYVYSYIFLFLSATFLAITIIKAELLEPLNRLWMKLGLLIGVIVSPVVMAIIFFGLFTPVSLIMKVTGRDELRLKITNEKSHWRVRDGEHQKDNSFKHQF